MTCGRKHRANCPTASSQVDPAEVDARPRCRNLQCQAKLLGDGTCPHGCSQEIGAPQPQVPAGGWSRCPRCQGLVQGAACENPLCAARWREPQPGEEPGPENGWRWQPPARSPGAAVRKKHGIPTNALVIVSDPWDTGDVVLTWYDPQKRGMFGAAQEDSPANAEEQRQIRRLTAECGASGFVELDPTEWREAHPVVVNPLVAAPGVGRGRVLESEAELEQTPPPNRSAQRQVTFVKKARDWRALDGLREGAQPQREALLYTVFASADMDTPMDINLVEGGFVTEDKATTPRAFAAERLHLWGLGGQGHHPQAQHLAEQCGVQLVAGELCPMQQPAAGAGNPDYLGDYTIDGMPVAGLALELNRHLVAGFPGDTRAHGHGRDGLERVLDYDDWRHNRQNWATVEIGWVPEARTKRHAPLWGWWRAQGEDEAVATAGVVAEFFLRLGHDPQADLYYRVGDQQRKTTVGEAARAHQARPLPGTAAGPPPPLPSARIICPFCHKPQAESVCRNPLCPSRWKPPGVPAPDNGWRWARPDVPFGQTVGDDLRSKYQIPSAAAAIVCPSHSGMWEIEFYDPARRGMFSSGQLVHTDPQDYGAIEKAMQRPDRSGFVRLADDEMDRLCPQIIEPLVAAPGVNRRVVEQVEAELAARRPPAEPELPPPPVEFVRPAHWQEWDKADLARKLEREQEFLAQFGAVMDVPMQFSYEGRAERELLTPRQFAARRLGLYGIGSHRHHEHALELATRCGVTLTNEETCPVGLPMVSLQGNAEYLLDYTVDGQPIAAFGLDMNRHLMFCFPDDFRMHAHGWDVISRQRDWADDMNNRQNWVVVHVDEDVGTKRHAGINVDARRHAPADREAITREVAELLLRLGHDPEAPISYWRGENDRATMTLHEAAAGHAARSTPAGLAVTESGQRLLRQVVEPYLEWAFQHPVSGTPQATRAANQLARAARYMREALVEIGVGDERLLHDLTEFSLTARDQAEQNVTVMLATFNGLKAGVHVYLRESPQAAARYGAGLARLFCG